jgi:hypothetical protein
VHRNRGFGASKSASREITKTSLRVSAALVACESRVTACDVNRRIMRQPASLKDMKGSQGFWSRWRCKSVTGKQDCTPESTNQRRVVYY